MEPYQALANAIVELAAKDYRTALKYHYKHPENAEYKANVAELEEFFLSGWFELLTDLDGRTLMINLRRMVKAEVGV